MDNNDKQNMEYKNIECNLTMAYHINDMRNWCKEHKVKNYSKKNKEALFDFISSKFNMVPKSPKYKLSTGKYINGLKKNIDIPIDTIDTPDTIDTTDYKALYIQSQKDLENLQALYDKLKASIKPIEPIEPIEPIKPIEPKSNKIIIKEYSDKSIVILGDTKPIKDLLKSNNCKYNRNLKCGSGWICSIKNRDNIINILKPYM